MKIIVHTSRIAILRGRGPLHSARIEGFERPVHYGVHDDISRFCGVDPIEEHAATLDHTVGAVGA